MNYKTIVLADSEILVRLEEAKRLADYHKALYDNARDDLLDLVNEFCGYSSDEKMGVCLDVVGEDGEDKVVYVTPKLKMSVTDYHALPDVVKPHTRVTELVTVTKYGKEVLDKYLTKQFGSVDYAGSDEYFGGIGIKSQILMSVNVKNA